MTGRKYKPTEVSSVCVTCGSAFSYVHRIGMRKKHCSEACRTFAKVKMRDARHAKYPRCVAEGCKKAATRVSAGLCETHYYRLRRTNSLAGKEARYRYVSAAGYVLLKEDKHPLAMKGGNVFEHRKIAYETHGGACPACFWCGSGLEWGRAVVDHLDENKQNNAPDNLVVSCNECNRARGAMLPFVKKMRPEAVPKFFEAIRKYRDGNHHAQETLRL